MVSTEASAVTKGALVKLVGRKVSVAPSTPIGTLVRGEVEANKSVSCGGCHFFFLLYHPSVISFLHLEVLFFLFPKGAI
jgi:hypothetical protein